MLPRTLRHLLLVAGLAACQPTGGDDGGVPADALSSGSTCPPGSTLTYESFGAPFFSTYCLRCHATANVTVEERSGAPFDVNFDTHELVRPLARRIDRMAAIGPARANRIMPLDGLAPSDDERRSLGEWIACGTP